MGLNDTPSGERVRIGFFGMRNAGKSSLVNAVTGQDLSVVSEVRGTTTDPVKKAMELRPLGPAVIIDTPGIDDAGELGEKRVEKARQTLAQTDIAVLVTDASRGLSLEDRRLLEQFQARSMPYLVAYNKADLLNIIPDSEENELYVSAVTGENINQLKDMLGAFAKELENPRRLASDLFRPGDTAVLVIPIDESAPKGRLILPQQQVMRDLLDAHCKLAACRPEELDELLSELGMPPGMVITDSQVFGQVARIVPEEIPLTSFSILFARYKGNLRRLVRGAARLGTLRDGERVLISEGCTHHRQCNDIGAVKLPGWIRAYAGAAVEFSFTSGGEFPDNLSGFALVIHCGGCMLGEREMRARMARCALSGVPMVNYGVAIAQMNGILERSLRPFPELDDLAASLLRDEPDEREGPY